MIVRLQHSKKYFNLSVKWKNFLAINLIAITILILNSIATSLATCFGLTLIAVAVAVYINKDVALKIWNAYLRRVKQ